MALGLLVSPCSLLPIQAFLILLVALKLIPLSLQCPPPPLDMSVTVKGITFGNFNSNFYSFAMTSETAGIGL